MAARFTRVETSDGIAVVHFDRGNSRNALNLALIRELTDVAQDLADDPELCAVVLTGRADNFSLGVDLKDPALMSLADAGLVERRLTLKAGPRMCQAWEDLPVLTIAAIEGWCVGGGVALALACDLRVTGAGSRWYVPEIERGFNLGWGAVPRITNLVGPARAKRIVVLAEQLDAKGAESWGLVDQQAPDGQVLDAARSLAQRAAALPPNGVRMCKSAINAHANALNAVATHAEMDQFALIQGSADGVEGRASFLEKRAPKFTGR